jgi:hypothetical protein
MAPMFSKRRAIWPRKSGKPARRDCGGEGFLATLLPMRYTAAALVLLLASLGHGEPAAAPKLSETDAKPVIAAIEKDRRETREALKSAPDSYLAAVRRKDFGAKKFLTVGAAADNDVRLEGSGMKPHHLKATVEGENFAVEALDGGAAFSVGKSTGQPQVRQMIVPPSPIRLGRYLLRLSHQGYPAIIVFDPKSPKLQEYHGIKYFPIDLSYRYVVSLIPDPKSESLTIKSTHSGDRRAVRVGWFEFVAGETPCRVAVSRLVEPGAGPDDLSVLFRDATTGKESYAVGRYVEPARQPDGTYVLDFNMAYSPACAYSPYYNCPIPPKENYLSVPIRAGEQDSHYH